jgi:O-acetyl-ADP-ribose deacetylase (regulator of RNase III)
VPTPPPDPHIDLTLFDRSPRLTSAWTRAFERWPEVTVACSTLVDLPPHEAVVAAGNSYGVMDGELDLVMAERWPGLAHNVSSALQTQNGYVAVGSAVVVYPERPEQHPVCVYAPTMRRPMRLYGQDGYMNVFDATLGSLWALHRADPRRRWRLAMPGLGAGAGGVPPAIVAALMAEAWGRWRARFAPVSGRPYMERSEERLLRCMEAREPASSSTEAT